ncbi:PLD nuclease N-terminal domain-containing protein [Microbacterium sp. ASV49]|uniref:PLD nuclease N-terminal domain-containing protein n=1 Tax=Microbacterium candidum TaxID=3041922 RepID=A0ABT7N2M2_9MICO|nr:PLD nuclease N-terminal domain-containing protein [Microbacterium sp. ASV49]MDL9980927.1 PLD nuclease N-terminal domain-containing protein [Microbacterium sp. ASV49]
MPVIVSLLMVALLIFALVDAIMRPDEDVRFLPKIAWVIIIILMPLLGSVLWFTIGRVYGPPRPAPWREHTDRAAVRTTQAAPPSVADPRAADPRSTEQQIADLDREIEEWRLRAEVEKRRQQGGSADGG